MKILVVAMSESIHTARWLSQITGQGWDIHLFPSRDTGYVHPDISEATVHHTFYYPFHGANREVRQHGVPVPWLPGEELCRRALGRYRPGFRAQQLARLIRQMKPDIVHSLEMQHAGYLTLEAKRLLKGTFPPWIVTNWGSDIYLFGRLAKHRDRIRDVLVNADFYSCECERDVCLAKVHGFSGTVLPVFPNAGGFDLDLLADDIRERAVSKRRIIMVKGYQTWAGRALVAIRALERSADLLMGYTVAIYSATPDVVIAAELFGEATGVPVVIIPHGTPHREILTWHSRARIALGLSISDAISTSLLESMVMGAFPIQSWTSCADEWLDDGVNGLLVPPEDPDIVEAALRRALTDNDLVDQAAVHNAQLASTRLDRRLLKGKALEFYAMAAGH